MGASERNRLWRRLREQQAQQFWFEVLNTLTVFKESFSSRTATPWKARTNKPSFPMTIL
jgi:hypothetical protein